MFRHKTSVLFASTDGEKKRTIQIPTFILLKWKKLLTLGMVIFLILGSIVAFFIYDYTSAYYTRLLNEKIARINRIKSAIDIKKTKASFRVIDENMQHINTFLKARGIKELRWDEPISTANFDISDIEDITASYAAILSLTDKMLVSLPLGKPIEGRQTSGFGTRENPFGGSASEGHKGLDFSGNTGTPVRATAIGKVKFAGIKGGYGNCVILSHRSGFETLFGHLSRIKVKTGDLISVGSVIGLVGSTGRSTGPHLHYEISRNGKKINPQPFLNL